MRKKIVCILVMIGIFIYPQFAKANSEVGSTIAGFLKLGIGARAIGMGEAYGAVGEDATALYWNPGGLAQLTMREVSFMHNNYLEGIHMENISYIPIITPTGVLGTSISYLGTDIEGYNTSSADSEYEYHAGNTCISVGYGYKMYKNCSVGMAVKGIFSQIDDAHSASGAIDIGAIYNPEIEGVTLGLSLHNIGPAIKFEEESEKLPFNIKFSTAYKGFNDNLLLTLDLNKPVDNDIIFNLGGEFWPMTSFAIRAGYNSRLEASENYSLGLGFKLQNFNVDCTYIPSDEFNDTYQVLLSTKF